MPVAAATRSKSIARGGRRTMLEHGRLPIASIARLAAREGRRPRPIYGVHKWFARRLGIVFRSLLVSANLGPDADFWKGYYGECQLDGLTVLDPFVGGGTSVVEARRLGADCIGVDVDPVACAVTAFELDLWQMPQLDDALAQLKESVGQTVQHYHRGRLPSGEKATVLHHFWVQTVSCPDCECVVHAHPNYILAEDACTCWVICAHCGSVERRRAGVESMRCSACDETTRVRSGPADRGVFVCPHCEHIEPLIDIARHGRKPPQWHLFAQEVFVPQPGTRSVAIADRIFVPARTAAAKAYKDASNAFRAGHGDGKIALPNAPISTVKRADGRITAYGYRSWLDLFNDRQLLHLGLLRRAIAKAPEKIQRSLSVAYSNHLTTNCMMAAYAAGWRRLTPLFSVRAFRHIQRPVEINPWVDGTGRGSFPNCVRKLIRAHQFAMSPKEPLIRGGFRAVPAPAQYGSGVVLNRSSQDLSAVRSGTVDIVLTDPPYFDNINYSELSEFFSPWMRDLGLTASAKATRTVLAQSIVAGKTAKKDAAAFARGLGQVFREVRRVLKRGGLVVFTFRHTHADAWASLATALRIGGLAVTKVFPMPGEAGTGLHASEGTGLWDAVLVLRRTRLRAGASTMLLSSGAVKRAENQVRQWSKDLKHAAIPFAAVDAQALKSALLVADALGGRRSVATGKVCLPEALAGI